jgi:hypothetical protein
MREFCLVDMGFHTHQVLMNYFYGFGPAYKPLKWEFWLKWLLKLPLGVDTK